MYVDSLVGPANTTESSEVSTGSSSPGFDVTMDGKLRIITINKPKTKNAFTLGMYVGFAEVNAIQNLKLSLLHKQNVQRTIL